MACLLQGGGPAGVPAFVLLPPERRVLRRADPLDAGRARGTAGLLCFHIFNQHKLTGTIFININ